MLASLLLCWASLLQIPADTPMPPAAARMPPAPSAYYAYADRDFIFTLEMVKPGVPLFNFVSMARRDIKLPAKNIRLVLGNRTAAGKAFAVEAGSFQRPMVVLSLTMHPRSSFGVRLEGDFGDAGEMHGAVIRAEDEEFQMVPLESFDFESLVLKVNRLNLNSPDFSQDWDTLQLKRLGTRKMARR